VTISITDQQLGSLLRPRSVALVGAADKSGFSQMAYRNLMEFGLGEHTYLVTRRGARTHGRPTVTSCTQIPEPVDVAFMMVPRAGTLDALSDAAAAGIRHALVLSSGYADAGPGCWRRRNWSPAPRNWASSWPGPTTWGSPTSWTRSRSPPSPGCPARPGR